jgi:hypothetical protein
VAVGQQAYWNIKKKYCGTLKLSVIAKLNSTAIFVEHFSFIRSYTLLLRNSIRMVKQILSDLFSSCILLIHLAIFIGVLLTKK